MDGWIIRYKLGFRSLLIYNKPIDKFWIWLQKPEDKNGFKYVKWGIIPTEMGISGNDQIERVIFGNILKDKI